MNISVVVGQFPITLDTIDNLKSLLSLLDCVDTDELVVLPEEGLSG
jgi:hypothetical protein